MMMMTNFGTSEIDTDVILDSENPMVRPSESDSTILKTFMKRSSLLAKQTMFEQAYTVYLLRCFIIDSFERCCKIIRRSSKKFLLR